tara:strand:+ start:3269 stop:5230 length:1962 start_codon:yes stop_codon:yes gene_type:complete
MKFIGKQTKVAFFAFLIASVLSVFVLSGPLERLNIDLLNFQAPSSKPINDIVIVGIDEESFAAFDTQWPWPREFHGMLVERLVEEGASQIIFDVIFSEPSNEESDNFFAQKIADAGNVILASDLSVTESAFVSGLIETRPIQIFEDAGAKVGLAGVDRDPDMVVRYHPSYPNTLSDVSTDNSYTPAERERIIKFAGPDHHFSYLSYFQFFIDDGLPPGSLDGKTVLIGLDLKALPGISQNQTDTFATPFSRFTSKASPGVEVHANLLNNLRNNDWVENPDLSQKLCYLAIMMIFSIFCCGKFQPLRSATLLLSGQVAFFIISVYLWKIGYFLASFISIPSLTLTYVASGAHAYLTEGRQKQMLKKAFSQYLSPDMVNTLIAEPDRLQLGGEKKLMTIMFCDVRGFTSISEKLKTRPEVLTDVINTLLTELSQKILETGGTIDKYMGDCIMAFWNAPVLDPMHAENAVRAARAMASSVDEINQLIEEREGENFGLKIGIGIATGECVVGNMGSKQRFDYTVLGDVVNLASRLEGQTKSYGTTTIICKNTATTIDEETRDIVEVDRIRVKGKLEPETIFGVFDAELSNNEHAVISKYLSEFRKGNFEKAFKAISTSIPNTSPILKYIELMTDRLQGLRGKNAPPDWDGVYTAETK